MSTSLSRFERIRSRTHLCVDIRESAIYWARSAARRGSMRLVDWGVIERQAGRELEDELSVLHTQKFGQRQVVEVALRSTEIAHDRALLPSISTSEARVVATRRCENLADSIQGDACADFVLRRAEKATAMWLCGAPEPDCDAAHGVWAAAGFGPHRLQSRHLALGQLVRFVGDVEEGELIAIFDLERDSGTCVLVDEHGWLFSREVPLRFMGRTVPPQGEAWFERHNAIELDGMADESPAGWESTRQTVVDEPLEDDSQDGQHADLLATELRRTFRYVQGHLSSGPVSRVWLTGDFEGVVALAPTLARELEMPVQLLADGDRPAEQVAGAAAAIGMAFAPDPRSGNLLPAGVRRILGARRARRRLTASIAAAALVVLAVGMSLAVELGSLRSRIDAMSDQWRQAESHREQIRETRQARSRAATIEAALRKIDGARPSFTQLLQTLGHTIPDEAAVQRLSSARSGERWDLSLAVEASGQTMAHAAQAISDFAQRVEAAPFATIDEISRESAGAGGDAGAKNRVRFRLEGRLAPIEPIRAPGAEDDADV